MDKISTFFTEPVFAFGGDQNEIASCVLRSVQEVRI